MRRSSKGHGLPPEIAALDHLGKQLDRKRVQAARATRLLRAQQAPLDFQSPLARADEVPAGVPLTIEEWFAARGWQPFAFQREVWAQMAAGQSGLLHASTGTGKTYAVWFGALLAIDATLGRTLAALPQGGRAVLGVDGAPHAPEAATKPLTVLWITPMRALAADTVRALKAPLAAIGLDCSIGARTGDTTSAEKTRQAAKPPAALVTTPESLTLMLARADAHAQFRHLRAIIVDEWHELIGNKRGVQTQLAIARLKQWHPDLLVWGLSATLGNLPVALAALHGDDAGRARLVRGVEPKEVVIDTLIPATMERFPWGGHIGLKLLPEVVVEIERNGTTLVFTNVRSQAEIWYQALLAARPDWAGLIALHHGSLDREIREWVEAGLKQGTLKAVVATSSLDLGVDFLPVARVLQIGSAKGIARLLQRAGRSGHAPGRTSRITLVPTNAMELVEAIAAREAGNARRVEARSAPAKPLDVLVQHLVTVAMGGGFRAEELRAEIATTFAYRELTDQEWQWALAFVQHGGGSLNAYPDYRRAIPDELGVWRVPDAQLARRHRMSIGTIVSDASMAVKLWSKRGSGKTLGSVEEGFIARLKPGDHLLFGGRLLELVRVHEMTAYVRRASGNKPAVPSWNGGRMPLSTELSNAIVARMDEAAHGHFDGPEMQLVKPLLEVQMKWSALPTQRTLLAEALKTREGWHLFLYPYGGRNVHLGLASLLAWRIGKDQPNTFSIAVNDYGFELLSATEMDWERRLTSELFTTEHLLEDVLESLNATELAQRRFREIARISGLVFTGYPGVPKSARQVQASSSLFYDVFRKYDPDNLLLTQSQQEVLRQELDVERLRSTLLEMKSKTLHWQQIKRPTPFAFPLLVERFRESSSSEKLSERIARMVADLEKAAGEGGYEPQESIEKRDAFSVVEPKTRRRKRERKDGRPRIIRPRARHGL